MNIAAILQSVLPPVKMVLLYLNYGFLALALLAGIIRLLLIGRSTTLLKQHVRSLRSVDYRRFQDSEHVMPVSLILPALYDTDRLKEQVENLLALDFKQYELIVVADSEHTNTWASLSNQYKLIPFQQPYKKTLKSAPIEAVYRSAKDVRLVVLDCRGASFAGAFNAGVNLSLYPIIATAYPDLRLTKDALLKAVYAFVSDPACLYIGSFARIGDTAGGLSRQNATLLAEEQYLERLRVFYTLRAGYSDLGLYLPLSHSFGAFLKSAVMESGGFSETAKAEGADLLLRIHARMRREKRTYSVRLMPDTLSYQLPRKSMRGVRARISAGQKEMQDTIRRNRTAAREIPGVNDTRVAEKFWPVIEMIGVVTVIFTGIVGVVTPWFTVLYLLLGVFFGSVQTVLAALLEEYAFQRQTDTGLLLRRYLIAIFSNFGFRLRTTLARIFA